MSVDDVSQRLWLTHKTFHMVKLKDNQEENRRLETFKKSHSFIEYVNSIKNITYKCGHNGLSHWERDEYLSWLYSQTPHLRKMLHSNKTDPEFKTRNAKHVFNVKKYYREKECCVSIDWCAKGVVTPVKNQGSVGTCWAFAAIGAIESAYAIKKKKLFNLSEQQLVDCTGPGHGCKGGVPHKAFDYAMDNGLATEKRYPYESAQGTCRYDGLKGLKLKGYQCFNRAKTKDKLSDETLKWMCSKMGPTVVAIDASYSSFALYKEGLYFDVDALRNPPDINHAVLLVGYGQYDKQYTHWKIKNSWGSSWGKGGYINVIREYPEYLGISSYFTAPQI